MNKRRVPGSRSIRSRINLSALIAVIIVMWGNPVQSRGQATEVEGALRARMEAYWNAMQRNDYETASRFIVPESRNVFIFRIPKGPIVRWKIEMLEFHEDKKACDTVVLVGRPIPIPIGGAGEVPDFPVENLWVLLPEDGEWYLKLPWKGDENPVLKLYKDQDETGAKLVTTSKTPPSRTDAPKPKYGPESAAKPRMEPDPKNPPWLHLGERGTFRFKYQNTGTEPIRILYAHGDCHCTAVQEEYPEVPPGQSGTLEITLDTFGLPLGPIQKNVSVQFSDMEKPLILELWVNNLPNFKLTPQAMDFGVIPRGGAVEKTVQIVNESGRRVKIVNIFKNEAQLTVTVDKPEIGPGETLVVTFKIDPTLEGEFRDTPMLRTDLQAEPLINIPVRGRVSR